MIRVHHLERSRSQRVLWLLEELGVGGGHRSMAKGIIPVKAFRERYGKVTREQVESVLFDAFMRAIHDGRE